MSDAVPVSEVVPGLHRIELQDRFVSAYLLVLGDELVLVDTGTPGSDGAILGALARLGHDASRLTTILLTHAHADHSGSAAALREATGARILLSQTDADLVASGWASRGVDILDESVPLPPGITAADLAKPAPIPAFDVDAHLEPGAVPGVVGLEAIHAPGHCAGQMAILWDRHGGALLCGDALANFEGVAIAGVGEDFDLARRSAEELARREFDIAAFGHGDPVVGNAAAAVRTAVGGPQ
jgi:glyoxylase-like metal-dependent hydrolase (beta-lactamase superfamily II)